jgi:hypothetical protein
LRAELWHFGNYVALVAAEELSAVATGRLFADAIHAALV